MGGEVAKLLTSPPSGWVVAAALGLFVIWLLLRRKIVPEQNLIDQQRETERWRTAYENEHTARLENLRQLDKLVEKTDLAAARDELAVSILQALREKAGLA